MDSESTGCGHGRDVPPLPVSREKRDVICPCFPVRRDVEFFGPNEWAQSVETQPGERAQQGLANVVVAHPVAEWQPRVPLEDAFLDGEYVGRDRPGCHYASQLLKEHLEFGNVFPDLI